MNKNLSLKFILIYLLLTGVYADFCDTEYYYIYSTKISSSIFYSCQSIATIVSTCNTASKYLFVAFYNDFWEDVFSCQTIATISACSSPNVVYQTPLGAYRCTPKNSLNSTYQSDCGTDQYLFFSTSPPISSYACTTITSTTTLCTGNSILYYDDANNLYSCQIKQNILYNCYYDVVPYAIEAKENSNNLINALTCITAADINTKCSTVSYPLIFYDYNDYTHYCKNQREIASICNFGVFKGTYTLQSNPIFDYYQCFDNFQQILDACDPLKVFYNPQDSGATPATLAYYSCIEITSTTCTSPQFLFKDSNSIYSCQLTPSIVSSCAQNIVTQQIYAIEISLFPSVKGYICQVSYYLLINCFTSGSQLQLYSLYKAPTGQYKCVEKNIMNSTYGSNCVSNPPNQQYLIMSGSRNIFYFYSCLKPTSILCDSYYFLFQDVNHIYSCQFIENIAKKCLAVSGQVMYKGKLGESDIMRCAPQASLNSTITTNQECASGYVLWQDIYYDYYSCKPLTSSICNFYLHSYLFYDQNSLYSCKLAVNMKGICATLSPTKIVYRWTSTLYSPNLDIYQCFIQASLDASKSSIDTCQNSGVQLWMNPSLSSTGFYNCQALTTTTCSSAITNSLMYEDKTLGIFFCKLYNQIANTCGFNKIYKYIRNGVTVYYCTTLSNLQNVLIPACQNSNSQVRQNLQNTASQPYTPDNYECVLLSPVPICTSPNLIYLQTATPSIYSCLTASQIVSICSSRAIYQKIVSTNSIFMCNALSTLHSDHIGNCLIGQKLWLSPANGNNPASYICQAIPPNPCTGSNVLYYDTVNQVYECKTIISINSLCSDSNKVNFKQTEPATSLLYYSCQQENNLQTLCIGTDLIYLDVEAPNVYQCLTKAEIISTCGASATYKKQTSITFYQCVTYSTLNSSKLSDCTGSRKLWLNPGDANNPPSYVCTAITSTQCQSQSALMYYDNINYHVYSCLSASSMTTTCSGASQIVYQWVSVIANEGTFYQCQALSTLNTTKSADCTSGKKLWLDEVNNPNSYVCTAIDGTTCNPNSVFYDIVNGVYNCQTQANIQSACANKVYTWAQSNAIYYSCQTASAISNNCPGELVFYDAIANVYSCKTKVGIISTCGADATYKKTSPITFYQCVTYSTLNSSKSSDCTSPQKLWLNPGDANNPPSYVCTPITSTQCQSQSALMYYDNINYDVYSCLSASSITTACSGASQIVYQWVSAIANEGTFYQCQALSTLNTTKSADCTSGKKLWFDEVNSPNSYVCTLIDDTTCNPNSVFYDIVNVVYNCEAQADIKSACANKVYTWAQSNAIYYSCQTENVISTNCPGELVFYAGNVYSCKTKAGIMSTCGADATYKKTSPITFYQCVTLSTLNSSKSSDCTSPQKLWLNPGDANNPPSYVCTTITSTQCQSQSALMYYDNINYHVYSCLSASSITTACSGASQIVYQWVSAIANEGTFYQCQALSTLNTTKSADCTSGKKLWFDEVNSPNSYVCTTIDGTTCNPNSVFYDIVNGVYNCQTQANIQSACANKVYTWAQSNAIYYSCQTANAISNNCPGELVFYDAIANDYSCKTKVGIISTCGADATYKKTSPITFYQCVTYSTLNSSKSSDCTSPQKLWFNPGDANNPPSYVCTTITSTQCQSQSALMYYDNINYDVYSCLSASSITTACSGASQIVYQWVSAIANEGTFYQCQALSTLNTTKSADCTSGKKLWFDEVNSPNSYVCTLIDDTTCNPNSVFYDIVNVVYNCEAQADIKSVCSDKVYTWTQSNAIYYSCQTENVISTNCPGELVFYAGNVYSCKTKAGIISTCGADATYKKQTSITFYQCVTYSTLNSSKSSDCTGSRKLWLNPGDANNPPSYVCTAITSTQCQSQSALMYYDNINYHVYSCLSASSITTTCSGASQIVYQWVSAIANEGTFYQCQALSTLNTTKSADCTSGKKLWLDEVNIPNSYVCTSLILSTCAGSNLLYYDNLNFVYQCNSQTQINTLCNSNPSNPNVVSFLIGVITCYQCQTSSQCSQPGYYKFIDNLLTPPFQTCTQITSTTCGMGTYLYLDSSIGVYSCQTVASLQTKCPSSNNALFTEFLGRTSIYFYVCSPISSLNTTYHIQCGVNQILLYHENDVPQAYKCQNISPNPCSPLFTFLDLTVNLYSCVTSLQLPTLCRPTYLSQTQDGIYQCYCTTTQITLDSSQTICISHSIPGCLTYQLSNPSDFNSLYCTSCNTETDCVDNCLSYSFDNKVCLKCLNGFNQIFNSKKKYICLSTSYIIPANCTQIDQNNAIKCITCEHNYMVNYQTNKCIPIIQNCSLSDGNTCVKCQDGHILINGVCVNPPDNCFLYDQKTAQCITCLGGYLVNQQGTCSVDLSCPNLQYRDFATNTCVYGQIPNCLTYTKIGDGLCSKCQTNYQMDLIGFFCTQIKKKIVCQPNTPQYNYVVIRSNCVKVDANCAPSAYNQDGSCQSCNLGYNQVGGLCYLDKTNLQSNVDQQPQSINCASSQYLVGTNCIPIPSNCNNFNRITNLCQGCSNNLILFNNQCVSLITCPSGSYSIGTSCVPVDQNCVIFDYNNKVCSLCITNYTPQGAQCINNAISNPCPNSRTWYNSVTGLCIGISQTCDTFNKNTGECITCRSPYVIVSTGKCGVDSSNAVIECPFGQVKIANNVCVQAVANCKTYQPVLGYCLTCQRGYFLNIITPTYRTCS